MQHSVGTSDKLQSLDELISFMKLRKINLLPSNRIVIQGRDSIYNRNKTKYNRVLLLKFNPDLESKFLSYIL